MTSSWKSFRPFKLKKIWYNLNIFQVFYNQKITKTSKKDLRREKDQILLKISLKKY